MNRSILLLFVLFIFSCKYSAPNEVPNLSGKYVVVGFKVKSDMERNGSALIAATNEASYAFNFINSETLQLSPKFGMEYFPDSVFHYKITDKTLYLAGKNGDLIIPYRRDGIILNLFINKNGIDTLQITPIRK